METTSAPPVKSAARFIPHIIRVLMGLAFFVFGLNGFFHFIPEPKTMPEAAGAFFGAMQKTGFMLPLIFGTQILGGVLLLVNRFVPLGLALLAPVLVNIVAFHLFLVPSGIIMALIFLAMELYLAWSYRAAFCPMLRARVMPGVQPSCAS